MSTRAMVVKEVDSQDETSEYIGAETGEMGSGLSRSGGEDSPSWDFAMNETTTASIRIPSSPARTIHQSNAS